VAAEQVARAAPDGHILMLGTGGNLAMAPSLYRSLAYDPQSDFAPVAMVARGQFVLMLYPGVQAASVKELVSLARAKPGHLKYASSGNGSPPHLAAELFKSMAKVDILHVPYKGSAPMITDMMGGHVEMGFDSIATSLPHIQSGKLRGLAVTGDRRSPAAPALPTVAEAGLPDYKVTSFYAFVAPAATPKAVVERLSREITELAESEGVQTRLVSAGLDPSSVGTNRLGQVLQQERAFWAKAMQAAQIEPQ
jgi:tripartite-type tricarboxylate transporter receptor subunit TctC